MHTFKQFLILALKPDPMAQTVVAAMKQHGTAPYFIYQNGGPTLPICQELPSRPERQISRKRSVH